MSGSRAPHNCCRCDPLLRICGAQKHFLKAGSRRDIRRSSPAITTFRLPLVYGCRACTRATTRRMDRRDQQKIKDTGNFLVGPPVVLDLSAVKLSKSAIAHLVAQLDQRGVASWASRMPTLPNWMPRCRRCFVPPERESRRKCSRAKTARDAAREATSARDALRAGDASGRQTRPFRTVDLFSGW